MAKEQRSKRNEFASSAPAAEIEIANDAVIIRNVRVEDGKLCSFLLSMPQAERVSFLVETIKAGASFADEQGVVTKIAETDGPTVILQISQKKTPKPPAFYS